MEITTIPCLKDNYAYIIYDNDSKTTGVVDPSESQPIISFLKKKNIKYIGGVWEGVSLRTLSLWRFLNTSSATFNPSTDKYSLDICALHLRRLKRLLSQ